MLTRLKTEFSLEGIFYKTCFHTVALTNCCSKILFHHCLWECNVVKRVWKEVLDSWFCQKLCVLVIYSSAFITKKRNCALVDLHLLHSKSMNYRMQKYNQTKYKSIYQGSLVWFNGGKDKTKQKKPRLHHWRNAGSFWKCFGELQGILKQNDGSAE